MNSRPRQSNSMTVCGLAGSPCSYGLGAALIEADDSRCSWMEDTHQQTGQSGARNRVSASESHTLQFLHFHTKFASPLLPLISLFSWTCYQPPISGMRNTSSRHTNRLTATVFGCVSRHDVHWTVKVYQNGLSSVSLGRRLVTLERCQRRCSNGIDRNCFMSAGGVPHQLGLECEREHGRETGAQ